MRAAFARAVARGEMAAGLDTELVLDMLTGPYYLRSLFGHAPITAAMNKKIVDYVLRAAAPAALTMSDPTGP
jgi:hypothetical protein